ncbi:MAG: RnfABCDGE type electron transport complex subunit D [Candidatus Aenigmarchaeota archaeon]|nr:RnfABCDGE type electron transport complex subunit D [Candidatus Aenigmarchaeota archaeon]
MATLKQVWRSNIHYWVISALVILAIVNYFAFRSFDLVLSLVTSLVIAVIVDSGAYYIREGKPAITTSSVISGLIIGLVLSGSYIVMAIAAAVAILSKHLIKANKKHIFNPASLGILIALLIAPFLFIGSADQGWWGGGSIYAVSILGLLIVYKMKRLQMALTYFVSKAIIIFILTLGGILKSEIFNAETLSGTVFFFAFIMLIEPITSPVSRKGRLVFAALVAILNFAFFFTWPGYALIGSLLVADLFVPAINRFVK